MEGPTPVSALIHAATMVAAGVYMVTRMFPILTPDALLVIAYIGAITAILGATIAVAQYDIKRVLAYSTVSQLGYMIMGLGVGAYAAGFFHLMTHAAFKACLFLGSGSVIHAMHHAFHQTGSHEDPQDMRNMGGLKAGMPITFWTFVIATLALAGVPLTSGFLSKDAILAGALGFGLLDRPAHLLIPIFGFGAAGLTAFYMFRLIFMTFYGTGKDRRVAELAHESPRVMTVPLVVLGGPEPLVLVQPQSDRRGLVPHAGSAASEHRDAGIASIGHARPDGGGIGARRSGLGRRAPGALSGHGPVDPDRRCGHLPGLPPLLRPSVRDDGVGRDPDRPQQDVPGASQQVVLR